MMKMAPRFQKTALSAGADGGGSCAFGHGAIVFSSMICCAFGHGYYCAFGHANGCGSLSDKRWWLLKGMF